MLGFFTNEVAWHHSGYDPHSGTMKYRSAEFFLSALMECEAKVLAASAEMVEADTNKDDQGR